MRRKFLRLVNYKIITEYKAYITLEMTCIMPFVIFLICNICYMAIFLYDNSTMIQGDYLTALIAERTLDNGKIEKAEIKYNEAIKSKIVAAEEKSSIEIGDSGAQVESEIRINTPAGFIYNSSWKMSNITRADIYEPVTFIRNTKVVTDLVLGRN